ncbi:hypothetical protein IMG5_063220 [Ichthyophthirius multifiliis]|uniref:PDEase domain-containing protein n=1 Tax=Ichthyophthirius multifiliis TaxID=5932 RepID=G0QP21_ICHMU|nr:hypothetical protein IMG5_063220 [Ichthyophthirius multifiliis]EGR33036.1 hypothetical protein IMG5_063220 [Ichthyophthirius multifiliis]|eukprot:XP_004037022.1 hypothetical protein IMG5_063220 [Ichthyophthirius multifiliis]
MGYMKKFNISKKTFQKFLQELQSQYDQNNNPFHNFQHAIAVTHAIYYFLTQKLFNQYLDFLDEFTLLFSALGHDVAHTGRTNAFEEGVQLIQSENDKKLMCGFILHVADLTGPTKNFTLAKEWSMRICREFNLQVKQEQDLGIPLTPYLLGLDQLLIISKQEKYSLF